VLAAVAVGTVTGLNAKRVIEERDALTVTRQDLPIRDWPGPLDGLTIAMLTDLHRSETVSRDLIERAVDRTLELDPALVVLGGDYVTWGNRRYVGSAAESVARLRAPHGVFAVLGNHDDDRDMPAALARQGITVLRDQRTRLTISGTSLDLVGIRFWTRRTQDIATQVDRSQPARILLAHDPRRLREAAELEFPLVLSGHTHGGQVVLPAIGPMASRRFPVVAGVGRQGKTTLFVSRGIGTVYVPIRYHCPPEVALLTVRRADSGSARLSG
jgi:hypothetical protein